MRFWPFGTHKERKTKVTRPIIKPAPVTSGHPRISFSILTTPRQEPYLDRTIESLTLSGFFDRPQPRVRLVAGSPESGHLGIYEHDSRFLVDAMTHQEISLSLWKIAGSALKATWGHHRCLHAWRIDNGSRFLLVMEDDIEFARDWLSRVEAIIADLENTNSGRWLLTLYTPLSRSPLEAYRKGKRFMPREHEGFYGAQALLYPLRVRDEYMAYLVDHPMNLPHDLALPASLKALGIPIFASAPCLVQHKGVKSQGVSSGYHKSDSFISAL